jgi:heat shock protein HtpX
MGNIKTFFLMSGLMIMFMYVGSLIAGFEGVKIAFYISLGLNFFSYFFSDKLVLSQYNANQVNMNMAPMLYTIVERLSKSTNLPMPKVYIVPDNVPNAFATGRNPSNAAVAVTQGLLDILDENEVEAVIAHELSHIKHYDILTGSIAAVFASAIAVISNMARYNSASRNNKSNNRSNGLLAIFAIILLPIAATIIRFSVSRTREYAADKGAAYTTKKPQYLASALSKLEDYSKHGMLRKASSETAHMFIVNPFNGKKADFSSLFSTHPTTQERIARLNELTKEF